MSKTNKDVARSANSQLAVDSFRKKLAAVDLTRHEVYIDDALRSQLRDVAKLENMTRGMAGEALMRLGAQAYLALKNMTADELRARAATSKSPGGGPLEDSTLVHTMGVPAAALSQSASGSMGMPIGSLGSRSLGISSGATGAQSLSWSGDLSTYSARPGPQGEAGTRAVVNASETKTTGPLDGAMNDFFNRAKQRNSKSK